MVILAQRINGMTSVRLNAVALVKGHVPVVGEAQAPNLAG